MERKLNVSIFCLLTIVTFVVSAVLYDVFAETCLLPVDFLFYEHSPLSASLFPILLIVPSVFASYYITYHFRKDDFLRIAAFCKMLGKWKLVIIALCVIVTYASFTSLTYVTNDRIVMVSPLDLDGKSYSYSDVEKIETGFGSKKHSFYDYESEGSFFYKIVIDGHEVVFHMPSVNAEIDRYDDTYIELEEFDQALSKLGIPKEASPAWYEKCDFDQQYVDRFLRIIGSD